MKRWAIIFGLIVWAMSATAYAGPEEGTYFSSGVTKDAPTASAYATVTADKKLFLDACEDQTNSVCRVESQWDFETVAASQTDQVMGTTGAAGDNLHSVLCVFTGIPGAAVQIKDGTGAAINVIAITGGADTKQVFFDAPSADGGWKITTGTNTTCFVTGRFS